MAPPEPQPGASGSESSRTMAASFNEPPAETQQDRRYQWFHNDAANAATKNPTQDALSNTVYIAGRSKHCKQHAKRCEYIHTELDGHQLTI